MVGIIVGCNDGFIVGITVDFLPLLGVGIGGSVSERLGVLVGVRL